MDPAVAGKIRNFLEKPDPLEYRCCVIWSTLGLNMLCEFNADSSYWHSMPARAKIIASIEQNRFVSTQKATNGISLEQILWHEIIGQLIADEDKELLDFLESEGVIETNEQSTQDASGDEQSACNHPVSWQLTAKE